MNHDDLIDMMAENATVGYATQLVAEFLVRHDGYSLHASEEHTAPTIYSGGTRTLTLTITCPTGEPKLPREAQS